MFEWRSLTFFIYMATAGLLLGLFSAAASAAPPQEFQLTDTSVRQVEQTARRMARELSPLLAQPIRVAVVERSEPTPMASTISRSGTCVVIVNKTESAWQNWAMFYTRGKLTAQEVFEFAAAHEIAHCVNKLLPENAPMQTLSAGRQSETYADLFALAHLAQEKSPEDMKRILDSVISIREGFSSFFFSSHATAGAIRKVYEQLLNAEGTDRSLQETLSLSFDLYAKSA
ncbi:MAG TPA: hypothetical protein VFV28_06545 [Limnobacter sp.]|nr:hypothetical protein [Limnobacter sp.]